MKQAIKRTLVFTVCSNVVLFLLLAYLGKLSTEPRALIFIDFWGRLTVYSLWFVGYALYRKFLLPPTFATRAVIVLVCANVPTFLVLAYFDKLSPDPKNLPFIDFWGRLTVYSVWFMAYELYRKYFNDSPDVA